MLRRYALWLVPILMLVSVVAVWDIRLRPAPAHAPAAALVPVQALARRLPGTRTIATFRDYPLPKEAVDQAGDRWAAHPDEGDVLIVDLQDAAAAVPVAAQYLKSNRAVLTFAAPKETYTDEQLRSALAAMNVGDRLANPNFIAGDASQTVYVLRRAPWADGLVAVEYYVEGGSTDVYGRVVRYAVELAHKNRERRIATVPPLAVGPISIRRFPAPERFVDGSREEGDLLVLAADVASRSDDAIRSYLNRGKLVAIYTVDGWPQQLEGLLGLYVRLDMRSKPCDSRGECLTADCYTLGLGLERSGPVYGIIATGSGFGPVDRAVKCAATAVGDLAGQEIREAGHVLTWPER